MQSLLREAIYVRHACKAGYLSRRDCFVPRNDGWNNIFWLPINLLLSQI